MIRRRPIVSRAIFIGGGDGGGVGRGEGGVGGGAGDCRTLFDCLY